MSERQAIRVAQFGLGPIGVECVREIVARGPAGGLTLAAAIDVDPALVGRDVGELIDANGETGVVVSADAASALAEGRPKVVLHTTGSHLSLIRDQIETVIAAGAHLVSSAEELLFPYDRHPELAAELDRLARERGVVLLGTGVNPGFVMDTLALVATAACRRVERLTIERVVDASKRRLPLQRKVGAGLTVEAFEERKRAGRLGHVGLVESLLFVADGLGWKPERVEELLDPVVAERQIVTPHVEVQPGQVAGIYHRARAWVDGEERVALELTMAVGAEDPHDAIRVDGDPPVDLVLRGGLFGDTATVAALINGIPRVLAAKPGLRTMREIDLPRAFVFPRS
jgi:4-hydroxy-tetrahydrodipicolinate reductase